MNKTAKLVLLILGAILIAFGIFYLSNKNKVKNKITETKMETKTEQGMSRLDKETTMEKSSSSASGNKTENLNDDFYIRSDDKLQSLISGDKPSIVMFGTKVCHYCNIMRPYVKKMSEERKDINIKYVDIQDNPEIGKQYPIQGTPGFMYYLPGKKPYTPSEKFAKYGFYSYKEKNKDQIALVMSFGLLKEDILTGIAEEMVNVQ